MHMLRLGDGLGADVLYAHDAHCAGVRHVGAVLVIIEDSSQTRSGGGHLDQVRGIHTAFLQRVFDKGAEIVIPDHSKK